MRVLGVYKWLSCAVMFIALVSLAVAQDIPARLVVHMGFGGVVNDIRVPFAPGSQPACPAPLKPSPNTLYGSAAGSLPVFCVSASPAGLDVQFLTTMQRPVDFDYPPSLSCVTLKPSDKHDLIVTVVVSADNKRFPIECDIDRAFLYALSVERHGPAGAAFIRPNAGARAWQSTIEIPWSVLALRSRDSHLHIALSTAGSDKPAIIPLDVTVEDHDASFSLAYSPLVRLVTPPPSNARPAPRLHDIQADLLVVPDQHSMLAATFAQNDAATSVQRSYSQIVNDAPLPLPSAAALNTGPDTIITRTQPLLGFLKPSTALGDQDLRVFFDSSPFALTKVGSLASGYTAGYSSRIVSGGAFYGLQRPGLYDEAYAVTVTIPTPEPRITPVPTPTPIPTATPVKLGVAPPPLTTPGPIEESKTSHDPLATIAFIDSIAGNGVAFDNVSGVALGTNYYHNACASETLYCAITLHFFGSEQFDAYPLVTPAGAKTPITPPDASTMSSAGESSSYTKILSAAGSTPSFIQFGEMFAAQQADRFYAPAAGSVTAFAPLSGPIGHLVASYGTGTNEHVYSADLLMTRLTSPYGDVFTDTSWQAVIPFDTAGLRGWTFNAGIQSESVSDRVAELQQGLATSYFAAIYPSAKAIGEPVAPGLIRPQSQQNAQLASPTFGKVLTVQVSGGFQNGSVTTCAPIPKSIECATSHDHAATWAIFANRSPIGFGIANTASTAIPGDLALASTSRYFGSYVNAPGSVTSYVAYTHCISLSAGYTNAAYPTGIPLPQKGTTVSAKVYYPIGPFGIEGGYYRTTDFQSAMYNQSGYYTLLRFGQSLRKRAPAPGCPV